MKKYILIPILLLSFLAVSQNNKEKDIDDKSDNLNEEDIPF